MRQPYGQNFLHDKNIVRKIVDAAELAPDDAVVEIGPGKGIMTAELAHRVRSVVAVELDRALAGRLSDQFKSNGTVEIVNSDFLAWQLPQRPYKIVANLPYYLSTAIIEKVLPDKHWTTMIVMVQKEVGERIAAKPDTRDYGAFSLLCQYYATARVLFKVGPGSFTPPPKIDSVIVRLDNLLPDPPDAQLFTIIRLAFQQRRKTILNALTNGLKSSKETVLTALNEAAIRPMARPENLTLKDYRTLTFSLKKYILL